MKNVKASSKNSAPIIKTFSASNAKQDVGSQDLAENDALKWCAVFVRIKTQQKKLISILTEDTKQPDSGIKDVYVAIEKATVEKNNIFTTQDVMPINCIFVYANFKYISDLHRRVNNIKFTTRDGITQKEIDQLKNSLTRSNILHNKDHFEIGMMVKIINDRHHCASMDGQILEINEAEKTVKLRIWIIRGCEPFELDIEMSNIKPINREGY